MKDLCGGSMEASLHFKLERKLATVVTNEQNILRGADTKRRLDEVTI